MGKERIQADELLFIDYLRLFSKSQEQMDLLVRTVHVFSTDINMEFGMKKM